MLLKYRPLKITVEHQPTRADVLVLKALQVERETHQLPSQISRNQLREFLKLYPLQWQDRYIEGSTLIPIGIHKLCLADLPLEPSTEQSAALAPSSLQIDLLYEDENLL